MRRLPAVMMTLSAVALSAGCQHATYVEKQKVNQEPMTVDAAMQQRQWEPVTAYYENGDTHTSSTGFAYTPNHDLGPYSYALTDTGTFLVNVLTMPYTFYDQRDGINSGGVKLPPSYTAVPPFPEAPKDKPAQKK